MPISFVLLTSLALISLGGGLYEVSVIDPVWPRRPDLIQPASGGISRKRFWIPIHVAFELVLIGSIIRNWTVADLRSWLLLAFTSHAVMRVWSAVYFIPKALAFERAEPGAISEETARQWTRLSPLRFILDLVTCFAVLAAFVVAVRST